MLPFLPNVSRPSSLDAKLGGRRTEGLAVAGLEMVGLTALLRQHRGVSGDGGTEVARAVAWAVATKAGARVAGAMATGVVRTSQNEAARRKRHFGTRGWTSEESAVGTNACKYRNCARRGLTSGQPRRVGQ